MRFDIRNIKWKVFGDGSNHGSPARFWLPLRTSNEIIIFIDDDQLPCRDFIGYMIEEYKKRPNAIQGQKTKIFDRESYWNVKSFGRYGEEVDYVGTGGMVLNREIFHDNRIQEIPMKFKKEDLWLCYIGKMFYGKPLIKIESKLKSMKDGKDQGIVNSLASQKQQFFKDLRKMGWRIIKDGRIREEK